jgi:hypothetical protein
MRMDVRRRNRVMKTSGDMEALLEKMPVGRLAVVTDDGPYVVPVNYLFLEGSIYFHSALSGRKMDALRADPRVCFLVDEVGPQVIWDEGCGISQIYKSVVCFGRAEFVKDPTEKRRVLEIMIGKLVPPNYPLPVIEDQNVQGTAVVRVIIEGMTGKENLLSPTHTVLL